MDGLLPLYWDADMGQLWMEIPQLDSEMVHYVGYGAGLGSNDIDSIPIYELTARDVRRVGDYRTLPRARMGVWVYSAKGKPLRFF